MILFISMAVGFGVTFVAVVLMTVARRLSRAAPKEDRAYLDPLPRWLRLLWPLVNFIEHRLGNRLGAGHLRSTDLALRRTHLIFLMSARQFVSLCILLGVLASLLCTVLMFALGTFSWLALPCVAALGYYFPRIWMRDIRRARTQAIQKQLPVYLDFLTLAVEAGLNVSGAIQKAVEKGPDGPLRRELEHVLRDLKSGLSRADALRRFDERQGIKEITNFVGAVIQAERMGSGLASTLRFQAEQRRVERFQRAEKQAMEAPVKLVFPLIVFIFPVTFIVLGFPIAMKFMQGGFL
ncbi:type II secretion system F family protein [Burkholderia cenocepacia]|uniref:type II secretion system F family protein n=1 Tax=Burkholderia cenocepacia TaxID=95486 RepID=UPI0026568304|nr:type II secretion system F family protein [Burkholderia cenocepacia]MDN7452305.1 type II secretion system F family protein [Burkholderia cenocepacia]